MKGNAMSQLDFQLDQVLRTAIKHSASDVHLRVGKPPTLRVNGDFMELKTVTLTDELMVKAMRQISPDTAQIDVADKEKYGADFAIAVDGVRFRVSLFREQGGLGLVLRRLPSKILTPEQVGFPRRVLDLARRPRGLFLVTGPTGSGKTTSQASVVDYLLREAGGVHIITIEEPTEYRFAHRPGSIITQREVPTNVPSFKEGLRQALRQDPDVIVVGEMRDLETTRTAISAAETGHVVFGTLHTVSAAKTIDRLVEQFPGEERSQVRSQVSTSLLGVLCQQLLPRADGNGMVAAFEFMECTPAIGNLIRTEKTEQIESVIKTSGKSLGMQLLDDHLVELARSGVIDHDKALERANNPDKMRTLIRSTGG